MRPTFLVTLALAATLAVLPACVSSAALSSSSVISTRGVGPIHIGMTIAQAERRLGHALRVQRLNAPCGTARLSGRLRSYVLLTGQQIAYISVRSPRLRTDRGVRVGDPVSELLARYPGRLKSHPNIYSQEPQYEYTAGRRKLIFFTSGGRVSEIFTGRKPEVNYIEGCA